MSMWQRVLAGVGGLALIGGGAHANIVATGGYEHSGAIIAGAIALGVVVGALVITGALRARRVGLAVVLFLGLIAGEAVALLATAERVIVARDLRQIPIQAEIDRHRAAVEALNRAKAELPSPAPASRLADATLRLSAAETAVRDQASQRSCASNCAALLKDAVGAARTEVEAARSAVESHDKKEAARLAALIASAQSAVAANPLPKGSATPLADRLQLPPWVLDVAVAVLTSLAVNVLGGAFLAAAAHGPASAPPPMPSQPLAADEPTPRARPVGPPTLRIVGADEGKSEDVGPIDLVLAMIEQAPRSRMEVGAMYRAYVEACTAQGVLPMTPGAASKPLRALCNELGIEWASSKGKVYLSGIRRRSTAIQIEHKEASA